MTSVASFLGERVQAQSGAAMQMGLEALDLLRQIRDQTADQDAPPRTMNLRRPIGIDIAGGGGTAQVIVPAGVTYNLTSWAADFPGTGGRVDVFAGGIDPASLVEVITPPGGAVGGTIRASGSFVGGEYVPENMPIVVVAQGLAADGRLLLVLKGKVTIRGEPMSTNAGSSD